MKRDSAIEQINKNRGLTDEELKARNKYLKGLLKGDIYGPLTDDPFIDKPWLGKYIETESTFNVHDTLYNTYVNACKDRLDEIAVYVNSSKKTYTNREILAMIDEASKGFTKMGLNENSKVGIFLNGSVEEVITLLALNKIGATCKYIDFMKSVPAMAQNVAEDKLDLLIMDECFLPLEPIVNVNKLNVVIANPSKEYNSHNFISYNLLYNMGKDVEEINVPYKEGKTTLIINSSGTTGHPKPICHTDYSVNSAVEKMLHTDFPISKDNVIIKMIPSQIGLGLITSMYTGLISGAQVILIGEIDKFKLVGSLNEFVADFEEYKKKYSLPEAAKINVFTAPAFIRCLIEDLNVKDLSSIGSLLGAGSKMGKEELEGLEIIAKRKNCKVPICNGYGQNEMAGAIALNTVESNLNGSGGYPTYNTEILIVNPETFETVGTGEIGLILEKSSSKFSEYENMPVKTKESEIQFEDGSKWFNTCDLGYLDKAGFLHITGRITRVVIREDFKISLDDVESKIRTLDGVKDCATINSTSGGSLEEICVFIERELNNYPVEYYEEIIKNCKDLSIYEMPSDIILIDKIPYNENGKIDYKKLKKIYEEYKNEPKIKNLVI